MHAAYLNLKSNNNDAESYKELKDGLNVKYDISTTNLIREYEKYDWEMLWQNYLVYKLSVDPKTWEGFDALITLLKEHPYMKNVDETIFFNKIKHERV